MTEFHETAIYPTLTSYDFLPLTRKPQIIQSRVNGEEKWTVIIKGKVWILVSLDVDVQGQNNMPVHLSVIIKIASLKAFKKDDDNE